MTSPIANLVQQKTLSTGTGDMTLTLLSGRQSFQSAFGLGGANSFYYFISHRTAPEWEAGTGHLSPAGLLVRDAVAASSAGGARVNFSAGAKDVGNDLPAAVQDKLLHLAPVAQSGLYADLSGAPKAWARAAKPRVAFIGSSYTQHMDSFSGGIIAAESKSWARWWNAFAHNGVNMDVFEDPSDPLARGYRGANFGVSGQSSTQILARVPDVIARGPDACVLQMGSNNVGSVETVVGDVVAAADLLHAAGILPVYLSISLRASSSWTATECLRAAQINARLRHYLSASRKGIYVEANKYLCDPDAADGRPYAGALDVDGTHYNAWSAFQIGKALHEALTPVLPLTPPETVGPGDRYDAAENPYGNLWVNPLVSASASVGGSNGVAGTGVTAATGVAATSVGRNMNVERTSGAGTAVASLEARGPGQGNWQTVVFTPAGAGTSSFYIRHASADVTHVLPPGTWARFSVAVEVSAFGADPLYSGFQNIGLTVDCRNAGGVLGKAQAFALNAGSGLPNEDWTGVIETPPFKIPPGCDRLRPRIEVTVDDTKTGAGTVRAGSFALKVCQDPSTVW